MKRSCCHASPCTCLSRANGRGRGGWMGILTDDMKRLVDEQQARVLRDCLTRRIAEPFPEEVDQCVGRRSSVLPGYLFAAGNRETAGRVAYSCQCGRPVGAEGVSVQRPGGRAKTSKVRE